MGLERKRPCVEHNESKYDFYEGKKPCVVKIEHEKVREARLLVWDGLYKARL